MYREPNSPQNNRDFGTYGESVPPYIRLCSDLLKFHKLSSQNQHDEQNFHIMNVLWTGHMVKAEVNSEAKKQ